MTAVEWLENEMQKTYIFNQNDFDMFKQAKELEKQQIIDARVNGVAEGIDVGASVIKEDISKSHEIYYNETFNK